MSAIKNIIENNPEMIKAFLSGEGSYEMDEIIWDYYYDQGRITNYNSTDVSGLYEEFVAELEEEMVGQ
jgi:hypothetical protein